MTSSTPGSSPDKPSAAWEPVWAHDKGREAENEALQNLGRDVKALLVFGWPMDQILRWAKAVERHV